MNKSADYNSTSITSHWFHSSHFNYIYHIAPNIQAWSSNVIATSSLPALSIPYWRVPHFLFPLRDNSVSTLMLSLSLTTTILTATTFIVVVVISGVITIQSAYRIMSATLSVTSSSTSTFSTSPFSWTVHPHIIQNTPSHLITITVTQAHPYAIRSLEYLSASLMYPSPLNQLAHLCS